MVTDSTGKNTPNWGRQRPAFTLLELLCVLIVLSMIATMAVPRYASAIAESRAAAAVRRITTDLGLAQRQAKFTGTAKTVHFDPALDKYYIEGMSDPDHPSLLYQVFVGDEPYNTAVVSADFNGDGDIIFDGFGIPDSGGMVVIQTGDYRKELTIAEQTGRVTVQGVAPIGDINPIPKDPLDNPPLQIE
jgi:prepilin-type N-terminal cleavage/methylation domain-containing protein